MAYQVKLFVAGDTDLSRRAVANLERICTEVLCGNCEAEVVDILKTPAAAREYRVIATPVAVRIDVDPPLKVLGDLSDEERLIHALALVPAPSS